MRIDPVEPTTDIEATGLRVAVITAAFNQPITSGLEQGAVAFLEEAQADEILVVEAPGAFELPLIAQQVTRMGYDAVVCLGAVIEGDTDHYEHVAHRASEGLMRVQLESGVPVAFGILTTRDTESAVARSQPGHDNKGREAAMAAVLTALTMRELAAQNQSSVL